MISKNQVKKDFSIIPNKLINDESLSCEAKMIYIYVASKPEIWIVNQEEIMKKINIKSRTSMAKYAKELEDSGWISRSKNMSGSYDYTLYSTKQVASKAEKATPISPKNEPDCPENERPNNEHRCPKFEHDCPKNEHDPCPNFSTCQKMDTINTDISLIEIDYKKSNTNVIVSSWLSLYKEQNLPQNDNLIQMVGLLATSSGFAEKTANEIRATLVKIRLNLTQFTIDEVIHSILYTSERGLNYLATPRRLTNQPSGNPLKNCNSQDFSRAY